MSHPLQTDGQKLKEYVQQLYRKRLSIREAHREVCSQILRDLRGEGGDTPRSLRGSKQETPPPRPLHRTVSEDEEARISRMLADLNLAPKEVLPSPSVEFKSSEDPRNWCHDAPIPDEYQGPVSTPEDLPGPSSKNRSFSDPSPAVPARLVEAVERDRSFSTTNSSSELLKRGAHFSKEEPPNGPNPKKPKYEGSRPIVLVNMSETPLRPFRIDWVERAGTYDVYETFENDTNDQIPLADIYEIYLDEMVDEMQEIERDETQMIQNSEDIFKLFFIRRICTESSRVADCLNLPIKSVAWTTGYRIIQIDLIDFNDSKIQLQYFWQPNGALVRYGADNKLVPVNGKEYEDVACCDFVYILKGVNLKLDWLAFYIEAYSPLHPGVFPNLDVFYLMRMFMTQVIAKKTLEVSKFRFTLSRRFAFDPKISHMFSFHHCIDWLQNWLQPVDGLSIWVWDDSKVSSTNKKFRPKSDSMERLQYEAIDLFIYPKIPLWMEAKKIEIRDLIKINWNYFYHFEIVNLEKLDAWLVLHICEVLKKQIATQGCTVYLDENLNFEEIQQILAHYKFGEFSDEENPKKLKFVSEKHDYEVFVEFGEAEIQISVKDIPLELRPKPKPIPFKTTPRKFAHL